MEPDVIREFDPQDRHDALYSLASVLIFAWLLAAVGIYHAGAVAYLLLALATAIVGVAALRRRRT
jgi:hypothetical protein